MSIKLYAKNQKNSEGQFCKRLEKHHFEWTFFTKKSFKSTLKIYVAATSCKKSENISCMAVSENLGNLIFQPILGPFGPKNRELDFFHQIHQCHFLSFLNLIN